MSESVEIGTVPAEAPEHLDSEEMVAALNALSASDKLKLRAIEKVYLSGTGFSPKELLHEAMCRGIFNARKCPRDVPVMAFVVQTMRSIANHDREERHRETTDGSPHEMADEVMPVMFSSSPATPEEIILDRESTDMVGGILSCFDGDEEAQMVILGWSGDRRGKELREFVGVDQAALDYAIKRIRRTMMKRYPNGWTL
jgi:hypothetical protein